MATLTIATSRDEMPTEMVDTSRLGAGILYGPPGTGKTTMAANMADTLGLPAYFAHSHPDMMQGEIVGSYAPVAGVWQFVPKAMLDAWGHGANRKPGLLLVDDVQYMGPGGMAALLVAMDGARGASWTLDDGSSVQPDPAYRCILTMNGDPDTLDDPIKDRLWWGYPVMEPSTEMLARLRPEIRAMAELDYDGHTAEPAATFREWLAISEHMNAGKPIGRALNLAFLGKVERVKGMLTTMAVASSNGVASIPEAASAVAALVREMPSGAP